MNEVDPTDPRTTALSVLGPGSARPPLFGTREHAEAITQGRHPGVRAALLWLTYAHLPRELQPFSAPFYQAGAEIVIEIPTDCPELTTALNRLIEAKDSAIRAGIVSKAGRPGPVPRPSTVIQPPHLAGPVDNRIGPTFGQAQIRPRPDQELPGSGR